MPHVCLFFFFFFKQKTAYEITSGDWSSDVCSSDLLPDESCLSFFCRFYRRPVKYKPAQPEKTQRHECGSAEQSGSFPPDGFSRSHATEAAVTKRLRARLSRARGDRSSRPR